MASLFRNRFNRSPALRRRRVQGAAPAMPLERLEPRLALAGDTISRPMLEQASTLVMDSSMGPNPVVMSKAQVVGNDVKRLCDFTRAGGFGRRKVGCHKGAMG